MQRILACFTSVFFLALSSIAVSSPILCISNNNPFAQLHYLPCGFESIKGEQGFSMRFLAERSNIFYYDENHLLLDDSVIVDGEITRTRLQLEKRFNNWLLGSDLSHLSYETGHLDSFIEDWHETFNFVEWDREEVPRNQIKFSLQSEDSQFSVEQQEPGISDWSVHAGYVFSDDSAYLKNFRLGVVIPLGDDTRLLGAGETSYWAMLGFQPRVYSVLHRLSFNAGISYKQTSGILKEIQKPVVLFGSGTYQYTFSHSWLFFVQADMNSPHFQHDSPILGRGPLQVSLASRWQFTPKQNITLSFSEDIQIGASPDVTFQLSYSYIN